MARLAIVNNSRHGMQVHKAGCADLSKLSPFQATVWVEDHNSVESVVVSVYGDMMADEGDYACDDWKSYRCEFRFFPCCPDLPETVDAS